MKEPKVGDLIFTRWPEWTSRLTCFVTGGRAAHQELIFNVVPEPRVMAASISMGHMVTWGWDSRKAYFAKTKTAWCRWTLKQELPLLERIRVLHEAEEQSNTFKYSKGELILQGVDALRGKLTGNRSEGAAGVWARKLGDLWGAGIICSKAGNLPLIATRTLPDRAAYWSPSDTLRFVSAPGSGWVLAEMTDNW